MRRARNEREETGGNGMRDARGRTYIARKDLRSRINGGEASLRSLSSLIASSRRTAVRLDEQMSMAALVADLMISRLTLIQRAKDVEEREFPLRMVRGKREVVSAF